MTDQIHQANLSEKQNDVAQNMIALRKEKEVAQQEALAAKEEAQRYAEEIKSLKNRSVDPQSIYSKYGLVPGELTENDQLASVIAKVQQDAMEAAREAARLEYESREKQSWPQRLKSKFSDYEEVMIDENFKLLADQDPDFVDTLKYVGDEEVRREKAYKRIKTLKKESKSDDVKDLISSNHSKRYGYSPMGASSPPTEGMSLNIPRTKEEKSAAYAKLKAAQHVMPSRG